jgi:hypothetical protein
VNVTVAEVLAGAAAREVPLTAECVGYLVLGAADQIAGAPRSVGAADLLLSEEGVVRIAGGRAAAALEAERDLRGMLDALLVRASAASPGLLRASRRPPGAGIDGLVRELETALIPVNRSAAKRSLARLQRETRRAVESGRVRTDIPPPRQSEPAPSVPVAAALPSVPVSVAALASVAVPAPFEPVVASTRAAFAEPLVETTMVPPAVLTEPLPRVTVEPVARDEEPEHTVQLAPAPVPVPVEPSQAETRPEPVVLRASSRPTAPAPAPSFIEGGHTEPLPLVTIPRAAPVPRNLSATPLLGTLVAPYEEVERAVPEPDGCDFEILVESEALPEVYLDASDVFAEHEVRTVVGPPEALATPEPADFTLPCPPLAADSVLPPLVEMLEAATATFEAESVLAASDMITPDDIVEVSDGFEAPGYVAVAEPYIVVAEPCVAEAEPCVAEAEPCVAEAEPCVAEAEPLVAEPEPLVAAVPEPPPPSEIGLAVAVESELPPWVRAVPAPVYESAPPPRVAIPAPRQSAIEDLLMHLEEVPLTVDELCSGLKHLAGMEPTPAPPGAFATGDARKAER